MQIVILTIVAMGATMAAMAVGVIFGGRSLRGSCGGPSVIGPDGVPIACSNCASRKKALEARESPS